MKCFHEWLNKWNSGLNSTTKGRRGYKNTKGCTNPKTRWNITSCVAFTQKISQNVWNAPSPRQGAKKEDANGTSRPWIQTNTPPNEFATTSASVFNTKSRINTLELVHAMPSMWSKQSILGNYTQPYGIHTPRYSNQHKMGMLVLSKPRIPKTIQNDSTRHKFAKSFHCHLPKLVGNMPKLWKIHATGWQNNIWQPPNPILQMVCMGNNVVVGDGWSPMDWPTPKNKGWRHE